MKPELKVTVMREEPGLTRQMARAAVELAHLFTEEGEESVWAVIKSHYQVNHDIEVVKQCNNCGATGMVADVGKEPDDIKERDCESCEGKGFTN